MKKMFLYSLAAAAVLVMVIGLGTGTAYMVIARMDPPQAQHGVPPLGVAEGTTVPLREFVTNLADTDRSRYIKVTFELVARTDKEALRLEANSPLIRDIVLSILGAQTAAQVSGEPGVEALKSLITDQINARLGGQPLVRVLVTDFVVQF